MNTVTELIKNLADQHGRQRNNLLPILQGVVEQEKYLSEFSMKAIAKELDMSAAEVFGTATFYSFLEHKKMGRYIIRICKTISCSMKGSNQVLLAIEDMLKISLGETTTDGTFSILQTNCLGFCHQAPAMLINNEVYTDLTPEKVREILSMYINKIKEGAPNEN
ncbi:MAG: NAD(P)H-dependent oxidoreductase subunit E [Paludibacter sp.]|nr:NAD(P)H-dependent oxidoreductase subunit E [Paludibacter sp.]